MPWRQTSDPYKIMVSEVMLQQTQVARVIPKYEEFLKRFPNVHDLANARLGDVLIMWSGLGYNRRAKFLWRAAQMVVHDFAGNMPHTSKELECLPGVGKNTAGAILAYAYNQPVVFVETNIRSVLFHHFFADQTNISDKQLEEVLRKIMEQVDDPRTFYWAMMDYGAHLKSAGNNIERSKHYMKQSKFSGSKRELRGKVIKLLTKNERTRLELQKIVDDPRLDVVLGDLLDEQLIVHKNDRYALG